MTSPGSTGLGDSKCVGQLSSTSSRKSSRYRYMGALLVALVGVRAASVHGAGRPPFEAEAGHAG